MFSIKGVGLVDALPHATLALDASGACVYANFAALKLLGVDDAGAILNKPHPEVLRFDAPEDAEGWLAGVLERGAGVYREKLVLRRGDGRVVRVDGWAEPLKGPEMDGGAVVTLLDLTERHADDEQRVRFEAASQYTQKLESLSVLASGIALDFNNLLVGVLAHTGLALNELAKPSPVREHVQEIETTALRAADLSKQLLAISGKAKFATRPLNLATLLKEIERLLRTSASEGVELEFNLTSQLPLIEGDPTQIRQVMMHLVLNASEAIGDDGGRISIGTGIVEVDADYPEGEFLPEKLEFGRYIYVTVSDDGRGMDDATMSKIFDPFFSTKSDGHGLGLAAVLSIVKGHRGAMQVESTPEKGTTVKVYFPCSDKKDRLPAHELQEGQIFTQTGTILVVDDDDTVRQVTKEILLSAGFGVITARDGVEGVRLVREHRQEISLVVLDMRMPRMGGAEAFEAMREINPGLPILLASGYDPQDAANRLAAQPPAAFLHKPYSPQDLTDKIRDLLK